MPRQGQRAASGRSSRPPLKGHVLLDERAERRLRQARLRRAAIVLGCAAAVAGLLALYVSPLLRVQHMQVVGTVNVDAQEVARLADLEGDSMLRPSLARAAERLGDLPLVKAAHLERHWPQTVRIRVEERLPWGHWTIGGDSYVIDADGVVLPPVPVPEGAPVIADLGGPARLVPGDRVDVDAVALARAMLARVPEVFQTSVIALEYTPQAGLALTTDSGLRVVLGDSQNADYKLAVWQAIEGQLGRDAMAGHVLDLRFGDHPSFQ